MPKQSTKKQIERILPAGGALLGWKDDTIYCNTEDTHTLAIGATRCGKTRCSVLETICTLALGGESIIAVDPKSELYGYTCEFLKRLDYEVITLDFKDPARSDQFNFLQPVIDAVLLENIPLATQRARDIASMLVPNEDRQTDPIWLDGERSVLTMAILAVCTAARNPAHQNLSNAWAFVANMCRPVGDKGELPLVRFIRDLPQDSPVRPALSIAEIAPSKMRGSFYTSALTTLDLFNDPYIHSMTSDTSFDYEATGDRKRAIFIILPDDRGTYYPLASLFVYEQYQALVRAADERGGRLKRRVNFVCDEFGNFVKIPDFDKFVTVGGGRGIRFILYVQNLNQIYQRYGDKLGQTICANCETWIYLQTDEDTTLKEISGKLGKYTIKSPNISGSSNGNSSGGYSFTGRDLLDVSELKRIRRPYQLVTSRNDPAIMYAPDISQTPFNTLLGMGDPEHNRKLLLQRCSARPQRKPEVSLWGIWNQYEILSEVEKEKKSS